MTLLHERNASGPGEHQQIHVIVETAKHPVFQFLFAEVLPDNMLVVVA